MVFGIVRPYCGQSGKRGFYNEQEIGLARAMVKLGYECVVFYCSSKAAEIEETLVEEHLRVVYVPAFSIGVHGKFDWNVIKKFGVEVLQIGSDNQLFVPSLVKFCDKNGIRCYHYVGTVGSDSSNKIKKLFMEFLYKRNLRVLKNHKVFAKTSDVRKKLVERGITNAEIAHVGLDITVIPEITESKEQLREKLGITEGQRLILFVGRFDPYKHPFELIELAKSLPEYYRIIAIGSGALDDDFDKAICENNMQGKITRIKQIANQKIHAYYKAADYFVNFNENEIFGMSILEAMYHGCTVIAYHAPGPDEIIENGVSGILVENHQQVAEILLNNVIMPEHQVGERIKKHFLWDRSANKMDMWIRNSCFRSS